jgi:hypothetical protein
VTRVFPRAVLIALASVCMVAFAAPSTAQESAGVVRRQLLVVDKDGKALDGGGGSTNFGVVLEGEDECPGDSAHDQYRVDSYMVPVDVDPTTLKFTGLGPTPANFRKYANFQMPLYKLSEDAYAAQQTSQQATPGGPGPIREIPPLGWGVYVPTRGIDGYTGGLPAGEYRIGLACTYGARITNLWETTIEVKADPNDKPVGIAWTVTGSQPRDLESEAEPFGGKPGSSAPMLLVYALGAFALVMIVVAIALFRSSGRDRDDDASSDDPRGEAGVLEKEPSPT